jgi:hypothetical protein
MKIFNQNFYEMSIKTRCPKCQHVTTVERTKYFITTACENCLEFWEIVDYEGCCDNPMIAQVRFIDGGGKAHVREQCQSVRNDGRNVNRRLNAGSKVHAAICRHRKEGSLHDNTLGLIQIIPGKAKGIA